MALTKMPCVGCNSLSTRRCDAGSPAAREHLPTVAAHEVCARLLNVDIVPLDVGARRIDGKALHILQVHKGASHQLDYTRQEQSRWASVLTLCDVHAARLAAAPTRRPDILPMNGDQARSQAAAPEQSCSATNCARHLLHCTSSKQCCRPPSLQSAAPPPRGAPPPPPAAPAHDVGGSGTRARTPAGPEAVARGRSPGGARHTGCCPPPHLHSVISPHQALLKQRTDAPCCCTDTAPSPEH